MAVVWTLLSEVTATFPSSERWRVEVLPPASGIINYAFRILCPATVSLEWNTAGFFCVGQSIDGRLLVSRSHPIPLIFPGVGQGLRILGPQEIDLSSAPVAELVLVYHVHRWVPWEKLQVYGLF